MSAEDDVLEWAGVQVSCTATNGSSITVNLISRENKMAVWGKVTGCLSKEPTVFDRAQPMNRRCTDMIENVIDHSPAVTDEEKTMLLFGPGMP